MRMTWKHQTIPSGWQWAIGVFIPRRKIPPPSAIKASIALLNVEGKIFFSFLASSKALGTLTPNALNLPPWYGSKYSVPKERGRGPAHGAACLGESLWLSATQADRFCIGILQHTIKRYKRLSQVFQQPPHVLHPIRLYNRIATAGSLHCQGMFHLPHTLCGRLQDHPHWGQAVSRR